MVVSIDHEHDRVMVLSRRIGAPMVREGGTWRLGVYDPDDLKDFFVRASDKEAEALFQEARAAFESNHSRFMAECKARNFIIL